MVQPPRQFYRLVRQTEGLLKEHPEIEEVVESLINSTHRRFYEAYKIARVEDVNLTAGDALVEYNKIFGYCYFASQRDMVRNIRKARSQFLVAEGKKRRDTVEVSARDTQTNAKQLRARVSRLKVAFAFEGNPETNLFTGFHAIAIDRIERKYKDRLLVERLYDAEKRPGGAYAALSELIADRPAILFTTSPNLSDASLRVALENPDMIVLNCDTPKEGKSLNTYFSRMHDLTFLCGILAGAMSRNGTAGYMNISGFGKNRTTYEVNAFALGARLINPRVRVLDYTLKEINEWDEHEKARRAFASVGADVVFSRHSPRQPIVRKAFPRFMPSFIRSRTRAIC